MKGYAFAWFERYATERWGVAACEAILAAAEPHLATRDPFVGPATYPAADLLILVDTAARATGTHGDDLLRELGRYYVPLIAERGHCVGGDLVSCFAELARVLGTAILAVQGAAGAVHVELVELGDDGRLCALAEGLLSGVALHAGVVGVLHKSACRRDGAPACAWESAAA